MVSAQPSFHATPSGKAWAVRIRGSKRALLAGLSEGQAWVQAVQRATSAKGIAYRFDRDGRIVERLDCRSGSSPLGSKDPDVVSINRHERMALLSTGEAFALTTLLDEGGGETEDMGLAVVGIGMARNGGWWTVDMRVFDNPVPVN